MQKKLFITDFDGTLLRDDKTISQKDIDALKYLKKKGVIRCIATGRSIYSFEKALKNLSYATFSEFPIDYLIFSTGAGIMDFNTGVIMKNISLTKSDIIFIADYFEESKLDYMIHRQIPDTHCFVYKSHGKENSDFFNRIKLYKEYSSPLPEDKRLNGFSRSTEILAVLPYDFLNDSSNDSSYASFYDKSFELIERIRQDFSKYSVVTATSPLDHKSLWVEVFNKDVSKSKAASFLAEKLDVKKESVISTGNDYNDMDLLKWSSKGFVVENAVEELKEMFEQVPSNNDSGISYLIEQYM